MEVKLKEKEVVQMDLPKSKVGWEMRTWSLDSSKKRQSPYADMREDGYGERRGAKRLKMGEVSCL